MFGSDGDDWARGLAHYIVGLNLQAFWVGGFGPKPKVLTHMKDPFKAYHTQSNLHSEFEWTTREIKLCLIT